MSPGATAWAAARDLAFTSAPALAPRDVPLTEALGCALAGPLWARVALPAFDTAAMDGWAVRGCGPWRLVGSILAGQPTPARLTDGEAVEIATGAPVPAGADGVLPVEHGAVLDAELTGPFPAGRHIRRAGEECPPWTALLPAGSVLTPAALGLAAAVGHDELRVHPRPTVAAVITGSELLRRGTPGAGRVRDALGPMLPGAVAGAGGLLVAVDHVRDERAELRGAVESASADVILTTGASSVGPADFLPAVLHELGARVLVRGVAVRPGHPQLLARLADGRLLVGLPGNPLAALAALVTVLVPLLAGLAGRPRPVLGTARTAVPLPAAPHDVRLVPVVGRGALVTPTGHGGSAMLRGAAAATAFGVVPAGRDVDAGGELAVAPLPGAEGAA